MCHSRSILSIVWSKWNFAAAKWLNHISTNCGHRQKTWGSHSVSLWILTSVDLLNTPFEKKQWKCSGTDVEIHSVHSSFYGLKDIYTVTRMRPTLDGRPVTAQCVKCWTMWIVCPHYYSSLDQYVPYWNSCRMCQIEWMNVVSAFVSAFLAKYCIQFVQNLLNSWILFICVAAENGWSDKSYRFDYFV